MVSQNPKGDRPSVAIDLPDSQLAKLREIFSFCLGGVQEDLKAPGRLSEPEKARRDADAYQHLLAALDGGRLVPEPDIARAVEEVAASVDLNNEYERVLAEHDALQGLLAQIEGARAGEADDARAQPHRLRKFCVSVEPAQPPGHTHEEER